MDDHSHPLSVLVPPGEGRHLRAGRTRPTVKIGPHLGSRLLGLVESELRPGPSFPVHVHDEYEEAFYVLEGEIEYLVDGAWLKARAGSTVFVPAGQPHGFRNPGQQPARHLALASPAVAMTMVEEAVAAPENLAAIYSRYASRLAE
jgi:quercetin dioxygenase-like cupin family protein